jgi:predicted ATP-dependent protease
MQESVSFAFTIAINLIKQQYGSTFFDNYPGGLHIHTPDGATSKDGPSAGSAFTLGFISRILNKRIKNDISITGEIERDGCITAIGGLEYKLPGAKKAGARLVFIPKENEKDLQKIIENNKSLFDDNFRYLIVDHIRDVLDMAFIDDKYKENSTYEKLFDCKKYLNEIGKDIAVKKVKSKPKLSLQSLQSSSNESGTKSGSKSVRDSDTVESDNNSSYSSDKSK